MNFIPNFFLKISQKLGKLVWVLWASLAKSITKIVSIWKKLLCLSPCQKSNSSFKCWYKLLVRYQRRNGNPAKCLWFLNKHLSPLREKKLKSLWDLSWSPVYSTLTYFFSKFSTSTEISVLSYCNLLLSKNNHGVVQLLCGNWNLGIKNRCNKLRKYWR